LIYYDIKNCVNYKVFLYDFLLVSY
jgi:hypothetical protein